jgi:hypothetical protein
MQRTTVTGCDLHHARYDAAELEDHLPRVVHVQTGTNPNQITSAGDAAAAAPAV